MPGLESATPIRLHRAYHLSLTEVSCGATSGGGCNPDFPLISFKTVLVKPRSSSQAVVEFTWAASMHMNISMLFTKMPEIFRFAKRSIFATRFPRRLISALQTHAGTSPQISSVTGSAGITGYRDRVITGVDLIDLIEAPLNTKPRVHVAQRIHSSTAIWTLSENALSTFRISSVSARSALMGRNSGGTCVLPWTTAQCLLLILT